MDFTNQLNQLNRILPTLPQQYHRLILIAGTHNSGKTRLLKAMCHQHSPQLETPNSKPETGPIPYLNLNLHLSQRLLDLTTKERPLRVRRILAQIIDSRPEPTLALDNIELLFEPSLHQDPLALLKELSRNKSLVVAWGGPYDEANRVLTYAEPGHPEYRRYERPETLVLAM